MEWLIENWTTIIGGITGIVTGASVIAKLTRTEADDNFLGKLLRFIDIIAINNKPTDIRKK